MKILLIYLKVLRKVNYYKEENVFVYDFAGMKVQFI